MSDIKQELDRIRDRISDPSFLANKGLSNEVGIHVFCYDPADELIVRDFVSRLKAENGTPYHIKECDLYEIFLKLLEDKRVLKSVDGLEEKRGKEYLLKQQALQHLRITLTPRQKYIALSRFVKTNILKFTIFFQTKRQCHKFVPLPFGKLHLQETASTMTVKLFVAEHF